MLGAFIALWYEIGFLTAWIIYSIGYPIMLISLLLPLLLYPKATIFKYYFVYTSLQYMLFCRDKTKKNKTKSTGSSSSSTSSSSALNGMTENSDPSIYFPGYHNNTTGTSMGGDDTPSVPVTKKTIIFIRHGESTWNYTFNKGNERSTLSFVLYFIPNLIRTIFYEYYYYMTGQCMESLLYDSPLSHNGIQQAMTVQHFIQSSNLQFVTPKEEKFIAILKGDTTNESKNDTVYMVSNLRRAITTAGIAFYTQLTTITNRRSLHHEDEDGKDTAPVRTEKKPLMIVSALQEISTNPDALCISPASSASSSSSSTMVGSASDPIHIRRYIYGTNSTGSRSSSSGATPNSDTKPTRTSANGGGVMDTTFHWGNKSLSSTGRQRIQEFCHLLFHDTTTTTNCDDKTDSSNVSSANNYIVTGHSLWFLTFFQLLLPTSCNHIAKKKKLQNGSIIGFTLLHTTSTKNDKEVVDHYMIDPTSLVVVHGGF